MLFLETNAFYFACKLSEPHASVDFCKLLQQIDSSDNVAISSITFGEFLTRYRRKAREVRRVCSFMRQHHITIVNHPRLPLDPNIIYRYTTIRQDAFEREYEPLLNKKIDIESPYCALVFILLLFCEIIFECDIDPNNPSTPTYEFLSNLFIKCLAPAFVPVFNTVYRDAYETKNHQKNIKHAFYNVLNEFISLLLPICKEVADVDNETEEGDRINLVEIIKNYTQEEWTAKTYSYRRKIAGSQTPTRFVWKCGVQYGKKINDKQLHSLFDGLENTIFKTINNSTLKEYLFSIVQNCISSGSAFEKNDIIDALILSTITPSDSIITFDNGMISHMKNYSETRPEYRKSVELSNSLLKY